MENESSKNKRDEKKAKGTRLSQLTDAPENQILIVSDIAGRIRTLERLLAKSPRGLDVLSVGDMVDRGPDSRAVLELFSGGNGFLALMGNHELMMLEAMITGTAPSLWTDNGGIATLSSFGCEDVKDLRGEMGEDLFSWVAALPLYYETKTLIVSHAPVREGTDLPPPFCRDLRMHEFCWNRTNPGPREKFQIFGHNSRWGLRWFDEWALCIDTSRKGILTGILWPSLQIFQEHGHD